MALDQIILQTVVLNGLIACFFLAFGLNLLYRHFQKIKESGSPENRLLTLAYFFILDAISLIINLVYRLVDQYEINLWLNKMTIILSSFSYIFLISFNLMLKKSERVFTRQRQRILYLAYFLILCVLFIVPNGVDWEYDNGIGATAFLNRSLNPLDLGNPIYSTFFGLYGIIVNGFAFLYLIYLIIGISGKLKADIVLYRKFVFGMIGMLHFGILILSAFVAHMTALEIIRQIGTIINLIGVIMAFVIWFSFKKS